MLNHIWMIMLIFGFLIGILNGRIDQVTVAVLNYAGKAVELCIGLLGIMCLWSGLMRIAEKCGLTSLLARMATPLLRLLFPGIPAAHPAMASIVMNITANFLGLGNAATPLGIKAMKEMQKLNRGNSKASDAMCMFIVLNTASVQFIPATIIAIRVAAGSQNPSEIICSIWPASICAMLSGIILSRLMSKKREKAGMVK